MRSIFLSVSAIVCSSAFFYALYYCVLRSSRQHQLNRCYLLATFLFSALLPFIHFPLPPRFSLVDPVEIGPALLQDPTSISPSFNSLFTPENILYFIYWIGVAVFAVLFLLKIVRLIVSLRLKPRSVVGRLNIVENKKQTTPYSFFHFLIINPSAYRYAELKTIYIHEEAHARQLHSVDLLLLEIVRVFTWFNPIYGLYKREIRSVHEYLADEAVVSSGTALTQYLQLMLKQVKTQNHLTLGHPFSAELLKSRIKMMKYEGETSYAKWKYAILAPLLAAVVVLYSAFFPPKSDAQTISNSTKPVSEINAPPKTDVKPTVPAQKHIQRTKITSPQPVTETSSQDILSEQTWLNQVGTTVVIGDEHDRNKIQTQETYNVIVVGTNEDSFPITTTNE